MFFGGHMHRREFIGLLAGAAALRPLKARRSSRREKSPESGTWALRRFLKVLAAPRPLKQDFVTWATSTGSPSSSNIAGRMDGTNSLTSLQRSWFGCRWMLSLLQRRQLP